MYKNKRIALRDDGQGGRRRVVESCRAVSVRHALSPPPEDKQEKEQTRSGLKVQPESL